MRAFAIPLAILVALGGCKTEKPPLEARFTRAVMVDPQPVHDDRQVIGEVRPRYESDLSFRVAGKMRSISSVGQKRALDTGDFQTALRGSGGHPMPRSSKPGWLKAIRHRPSQSPLGRSEAGICEGQSQPHP